MIYQQVYSEAQILAVSSLQAAQIGTVAGLSIKLINQSQYQLDVFQEAQQVDSIPPYCFVIMQNLGGLSVQLNSAVSSNYSQPYQYVGFTTIDQAVQYQVGSTWQPVSTVQVSGGTVDVSGGSTIGVSSMPPIDIAPGQSVGVSSLPAVTFANGQQVAVTSMPAQTIAAGQSVAVESIPAIDIAAGQSVGVSSLPPIDIGPGQSVITPSGTKSAFLSASGSVSSSGGVLGAIINTDSASVSLTVYDSLTASGNVIWAGTLSAGQVQALNFPVSTGIYIDAGATPKIAVSFS